MRQRIARDGILIFHQLANTNEKKEHAKELFKKFMTLTAEKNSMIISIIDFIKKIEKMQKGFRSVIEANASRKQATYEILEKQLVEIVDNEKEMQA